jgi:ABC-type nickel/cobalt efflux system permease component RcnA/hydrogenase/urease accessory protein HupE
MKHTSRSVSIFLGTLFGLVPEVSHAHLVNTDVGEFYAGMLHPLTSAEHLLPTLALALLASQCGRKAARWAVVIFPAALLAGILVGSRVGPSEFMQFVNILGLLVLGGLLAWGRPLNIFTLLGVAGTVGLVLGYRSGVDMVKAGVGLQFIPGVGLTGFIAIALCAAWVPRATSGLLRHLVRAAGGGAMVAGTYLLTGFIWTGTGSGTRNIGLPTLDELTALAKAETLSPTIILATLLGAAGWGAAHAFTPGHGKAIVATYLVGSRSTAWHAAYLGLTVTITHTLGIFALGLVAFFAQAYVVPEQLYPWLGTASGLIVCGLGASMFAARVRSLRRQGHSHNHGHEHPHSHPHTHEKDHAHGHDHDHGHDHVIGHSHGHSHLPPDADGSAVTWQSLLGLGISGGLLPCPAALVLLLTAVSLGRVGLGLVLVLAFSVGLAGVLVGVGLLFVKGGRLLDRVPLGLKTIRVFPALSSLIIVVLGLSIAVKAILEIAT